MIVERDYLQRTVRKFTTDELLEILSSKNSDIAIGLRHAVHVELNETGLVIVSERPIRKTDPERSELGSDRLSDETTDSRAQ